MDLYGAARAGYWDDKAADVAVAHPAKPKEVQVKFFRAAAEAWGVGRRPFWADVKRMKRWVARLTGVAVREGKGTGATKAAADAEEGRAHDGAEDPSGGAS